jgi:hypothetical protein
MKNGCKKLLSNHNDCWNCGFQLIPLPKNRDPMEIFSKDIQGKIEKALQPIEPPLFVAFEPVSAIILDKLSKLKDSKSKQKLLQEIVDDERFKVLDLGLVDGGKTSIAEGSKLNASRENTLNLAKSLNRRNIDVTFLPESNEVKSADAIIKYKKRLYVAEFKCCSTTKENTLYAELVEGFSKSPLVVVQLLSNMDLGTFFNTVEQLKRKDKYIGDIMLVNDAGTEKMIPRKLLLKTKYKTYLQGFL